MTHPPLLVGTYTRDTESDGIYRITDGATAELVARCDNPSFIAKRPQGDVIYAVREVNDYQSSTQSNNSGGIQSFFMQANGQLSLMNEQSSMGADPCHITVAPTGRYLIVSNYSGGTLTSFPLDEDGHLEEFISLTQHTGNSVNVDRQESAHIHSSLLVGADSGLLVADLGADQLVKYQISPEGQINTEDRQMLAANPGAGPRHMAVAGDQVYLLNELNNTVTVHDLSDLSQKDIHTTLSTHNSDRDKFQNTIESIAAHIELSQDGRFLYTSNRGEDSIAVFSLEGGLSLIQTISSGGKHPRHFALSADQNSLLVANMLSNQISCFERNSDTGLLTDSGVKIQVPSPTCLLWI